jgi:hypothetical protein
VVDAITAGGAADLPGDQLILYLGFGHGAPSRYAESFVTQARLFLDG